MSSKIETIAEICIDEFRKDAMDRLRGFLPHDRTLLAWLLHEWKYEPTTIAFRAARDAAHLNVDIQLSDALSVLSVILRPCRFTYRVEGLLLTFDFPSVCKCINNRRNERRQEGEEK